MTWDDGLPVIEGVVLDSFGGLWLECEPERGDPRHAERSVQIVPREWRGQRVRVMHRTGHGAEWIVIERVRE